MFSELLIKSLKVLIYHLINFVYFLYYCWQNPLIKNDYQLGSSFESNCSLLFNRLYYAPRSAREDSIEDYEKQFVIFSNSWTNLYCVKNKKDDNFYTLREYSKKVVERYNLKTMIAQEKHLLLSIEYWIFPIGIAYFEDNFNYYLTFDYTSGLRLDLVLKYYNNGNGLPETLVCFISAQILIAIDYLQKANVLVRDIHPQNMILKSNGYVKIISINQLSLLEIDAISSDETCGRIYFISPEYIKRNFWTIESDYWTFGIFIHFLIAGRTPFDSRRGLLSSMTRINCNKICIDPKCSYLLRHLLSRILCLSIQNRYTLIDISQHRWYSSVSFRHLCRQSLKPPRVHFLIFNQISKVDVSASIDVSPKSTCKLMTV